MKKVLLILYPQYADFQIAHTLFLLKKVGKINIVTASITGNSVESIGGLMTNVDCPLREISINEFDLIMLPGGDGVTEVIDEPSICNIIQQAYQLNIPIASICGAAALLGRAGILKEKSLLVF